ncbi:hypothetical protein Tco_0231124 [Tanacetum coccineum]
MYVGDGDGTLFEYIDNGSGESDSEWEIKRSEKARTLLLMAVPKDHLRRFHGMDDAKEIWAAIKTSQSLFKLAHAKAKAQEVLVRIPLPLQKAKPMLPPGLTDELVDCGMSSTVKIGLGYGIKSNAEVLGYEEEISRGIFAFRETNAGYNDIPLYSRFKHPIESDASSTVSSTCQSNDSDGEQGIVSDHSVNDDSIPIPSSEQYASNTIKTGRVNVNTGHGNASSGRVHVNSVSQFKTGASRFNTGKQHVNSGSVHVNSGTQIKSGSSRFNTGKQHVNSGRMYVNSGTQNKSGGSRVNTGKQNVNSGRVHVNTARV